MKYLLMFALLAVAGCTTVHQEAVQSHSAGFYVAPIKVSKGYLIDGAFRDRYNALIAVYGRSRLSDGAPIFIPALRKDDGIQPVNDDQWLMSNAAMENMVILSDLKRRGATP